MRSSRSEKRKGFPRTPTSSSFDESTALTFDSTVSPAKSFMERKPSAPTSHAAKHSLARLELSTHDVPALIVADACEMSAALTMGALEVCHGLPLGLRVADARASKFVTARVQIAGAMRAYGSRLGLLISAVTLSPLPAIFDGVIHWPELHLVPPPYPSDEPVFIDQICLLSKAPQFSQGFPSISPPFHFEGLPLTYALASLEAGFNRVEPLRQHLVQPLLLGAALRAVSEAALRGCEWLTTLRAWLQVHVSDSRGLRTLAAAVLRGPEVIRDCVQLPGFAVFHYSPLTLSSQSVQPRSSQLKQRKGADIEGRSTVHERSVFDDVRTSVGLSFTV